MQKNIPLLWRPFFRTKALPKRYLGLLTLLLTLLQAVPLQAALGQTLAVNTSSRSGYGQFQEKKTLKMALSELEAQHQVNFHYEDALLQNVYVDKGLTRKEVKKLENSLTELLTPHNLTYRKINARVYVIRAGKDPALINAVDGPPVFEALFANYNRLGNLFPAQLAYRQPNELVVRGRVVSNLGETLPGVSVVLKGTTIGTSTAGDGTYTLTIPSGTGTLVFSYIGFTSQEVAVNNQSVINVTLTVDTKALDEVVVIGYGSVTKRELTGAVASLKEEDFNQGPVTNAMQLLQGKVAGLSVTRTNGGDPTGGFEVRLRGSSSISASQEPLVVVDGIPGGNLNAIPPDDIESIDILKDGSAAAIYGTRGTNGVILVTTKRGKAGALQVNYATRFFTESLLRPVEVLSADEYRSMRTRFLASPDQSRVAVGQSMIDYGGNTDWIKEISRRPFSQIHTLSLSGGAEKTSYRMSLFYNNQQGILLNSKNEEYRVNLNLQQQALNDRAQFTVQLGAANFNQNPVDYNAVRQAIQRNPTEPVRNPDGTLTEHVGAWQYDNPVGVLTERTRDNGGSRLYGNLGVNFDLTESLRFGVQGGLQANRRLDGYYEPSFSYPQQMGGTFGSASRSSELRTTKTLETTLSWVKQLADHNFNVIGGYSFQEFENEGFNAGNSNFITDDFGYNNLGSGTFLTDGRAAMGSWKDMSRLVGFFGRVAYNLQGKYFLSASIRREGSTLFGEDNKWGTFPAISAAWDLTREGFMEGATRFDMLKVRAGYGVTGNAGLPAYRSLRLLRPSGFFFYNGNFIPGIEPASNPNPNLQWETKHEINVGIDWALLGNRLGGSIDAYRRDTRDLLHEYTVPSPPNLYSTTWTNVGSLRNTGVEFAIYAVPVKQGAFQWNVDFNADFRRNRILSLSNEYYSLRERNVGDIGPPGISAWTHQYREGAPLGIIHGLVYEGLTEEGEWIFRDFNPVTGESDGQITVNDRADIGNGIPDFFLGFTNTFTYNNLDLTVMARGAFGHQIINAKRIWHDNPRFLPRNIMRSAMDTPVWDDPEFSSFYVEDGDFLKIDNVTLGYNIPFRNNTWFRGGRIYFTGTNLIVLTKYSGVDPEVAIGGLEPGNDNRFDYPSTRTYTIGFNITF